MSAGQGSISFTNNPVSGGGGGSISLANNGLSLNGAGDTVQLGQELGAVGDPAQLLSNREVPLAGFLFAFAGDLISAIIDDATQLFQITDELTNAFFYVDIPNSTYWLGDLNALVDETYFYMDSIGWEIKSNGRKVAGADLGPGRYQFGAITGGNSTYIEILDNLTQTITLNAANGIVTTNPGSGLAKWKLGRAIAAAVVLDNANYVEVEIDGAVLKLALVN